MSDRLQEIRARLDAATPEPWERHPSEPWVYVRRGPFTLNIIATQLRSGRPADADLIAHAPADIAWLLDRVRDLEAGIVTACQIGVRGTTGQEAQALASLMHDLNVPGVDDA